MRAVLALIGVLLMGALGSTESAYAFILTNTSYIDGWLDGFHDSVHVITEQKPFRFPANIEHTDEYNRGYNTGSNEVPTGGIIQLKIIDGWLAGYRAHAHGEPNECHGHSFEYCDGFNSSRKYCTIYGPYTCTLMIDFITRVSVDNFRSNSMT